MPALQVEPCLSIKLFTKKLLAFSLPRFEFAPPRSRFALSLLPL